MRVPLAQWLLPLSQRDLRSIFQFRYEPIGGLIWRYLVGRLIGLKKAVQAVWTCLRFYSYTRPLPGRRRHPSGYACTHALPRARAPQLRPWPEAGQTPAAQETARWVGALLTNDDDVDFDAEAFEREFAQAQAQAAMRTA